MVEVQGWQMEFGHGVLRAIAAGTKAQATLHLNHITNLLFFVTTGLIHWLAFCLSCETNIMGRWTQYDEVLPCF